MSDPKVSIGLAVYNGERYLRKAVESILGQTYADFELIISDNASTDGTPEICLEYAARDGRITYQRNATNIGGANNENLTFRMAKGTYFRWAAHDDYLAPTLLEKCVAVLERNPSVVLVYPEVIEVDAEDKVIKTTALRKATSARPSERFHDLAFRDHYCEVIYGLLRSDVLRKTRLEQNYTDSDRVLLCELALHGPFYEIPEPLFYKRYHPGNAYIDWGSRMSWFNPAWKGRIVFPHWLQLFDFVRTIQRVPLPMSERLRCYRTLGEWVLTYGRKMAKDLVVAGYMALHTPQSRARKAITNWEQQ